MPEIISRKEAKARGLKRYFTGKPCKHGHIAERRICGDCLVCSAEKKLALDPDKSRAYYRAYYAKNRDIKNSKAREFRKSHSEHVRSIAREWRRKNPDKTPEYCRQSREKNGDKHRAASREASRKAHLALAIIKRLGIEL